MRWVVFHLALFCISWACPHWLKANDEIYLPEVAAASSVNWKDGYFLINGQPTFLTSGEMHYTRIPRELWRDRIWRSKQIGFNCMQMYVFWNATENREGTWDFSDNLDLDAWLSMLQEAGMYAVVRVGPYSCAEWEHGGFPAWLTIKPGMTLRDSGSAFEACVDAHLAQVEKIVAKHQINHGGNVIMVQLENEHPKGWGTDDHDPYLKHLVEQARANGIEIPVFLSGLHHGSEPSGEKPYDTSGFSPWYTTEFWTGWIGKHGDMDTGMLNEKIRGTWKIIAFGGAGYDYYMVHGGTNFGYSGDTLETSYDYSAPIGEAGQLRNFYFPARRAAYFAQSFSKLLTGSHDDPSLAKSDLPELRVTSRTNPSEGSIVFIDHFLKKIDVGNEAEIAPSVNAYHTPKGNKNDALSTHVIVAGLRLPHKGSLKVTSTEPRTVIVNLPWTENTSFESVCTNVMLRETIGATEYWICYGPAGDSGEITLRRKIPIDTPTEYDFTYPTDATVKEIYIDSGDHHEARLLVLNTEQTKKTWLAHDQIIIGPSFVRLDGTMEFPPQGGKALIYSATGESKVFQHVVTPPSLPTLSSWSWSDAATERADDFNTTGWSQSQGPQPMEIYDGFQNRYGWYRTKLHRDSTGPVSLHFGGKSGTFVTFLNGQASSLTNLNARAGDNTLAILCKIDSRPKLYNFTGPIGTGAARGLWGGVSIESAPSLIKVDWKQWSGSDAPEAHDTLASPGYNDSAWSTLDLKLLSKKIPFRKGNSWFRGAFDSTAEQIDSILDIPLPDNAQARLYLNGHLLPSNSQDVSKFLVVGKNSLLLQIHLEKETLGNLTIRLWHNSSLNQAPWYFRGGLTNLDETAIIGRVTDWNEFLTKTAWQMTKVGDYRRPLFWRSTFTYHFPTGIRQTIGIRTDGLKAGHLWVNGHNLGECPQKIPMYLPECWLKEGANDLVIFDLYGSRPDQVGLTCYETFGITDPL